MSADYDTQPYIDTIGHYREALRAALRVAEDPFKAPELTVATANRVTAAAWHMQVEYAAMTRHREVVGAPRG